jgi:acetyltransferase
MPTISVLSPADAERKIPFLADLLLDAVENGASVGFLPPFTRKDALNYWRDLIPVLRQGSRVLLAASDGNGVVGSVQLALETRANGSHRAEVMKLFVHRRARRQGLARALMAEVESVARRLGRTLLLLDTRKGSEAEQLFAALGYHRFGEVAGYARSADGSLHTTVFFHRQLT